MSATEQPSIQVVHYQRKRWPSSNYSLEAIFEDVRSRLADRCQFTTRIAPVHSTGILKRLYIILDAWRNGGEITHVTGDIHFANYLVPRYRNVLTIADCGPVANNRGLQRWIFLTFWFRLPVWRADVVTVISQETKRDLANHLGYDSAKVRVVPVAISSQFAYSPKPFNANKPRILQLGCAPNKNIPRLLEALAGIPCELIIVGRVSEELRQQLIASKVEHVLLEGLSNDEIVAQYQQCDIVAFASTFEGFGMPILEGQATGRVVVTSNISSMPEVAGDAACLVDPFSVESIRAGLCRVIDDADYRMQLIKAGLENVKRFDPQLIAEQYLAIYHELAGQSRNKVIEMQTV